MYNNIVGAGFARGLFLFSKTYKQKSIFSLFLIRNVSLITKIHNHWKAPKILESETEGEVEEKL